MFLEILWGYHTTTQFITQETPYKLVYGVEAIIPVEVSQLSLRRTNFNEQQNLTIRVVKFDLIEKEHKPARVNEEAMK